MHPPQPPLLLAALAFALGIAAEHLQAPPWGGWAALALAFPCLLFRRRLAAALLLCFAGWIWSGAEREWYGDVQQLLPGEGKTVEVEGRVLSLPALEKDRVVLHVQSETITDQGHRSAVRSHLELQIYSSQARPASYFSVSPLPGDPIRFLGEMRFPDRFRNPGRLSDGRRLRQQRVHRVVILKSPALLDYRPLNRFWNRWMLALHRQNRLAAYWPEQHRIPAFLNALIWGDRSQLDDRFVRRAQSVGVYHLLVVSGMHFALILGALAWIERQLRFPFFIRVLLFAGFSALLLIRVPAGPSVVRAALVASGLIALESLRRRHDPMNLLGGAALLLLCYQPLMLLHAGFQFSFVSCFVLARIAPPLTAALVYPQTAGIQSCWSGRLDLRRAGPSRDAGRLRFRLEAALETHPWLQPAYFVLLLPLKILSLLSTWVVVAFLIQNETFLLSAHHSNQGPGAALLANLVMIPLTSLLVILGFVLSLSPLRLEAVAWLAEKAAHLCYQSVDLLDGWTFPDHPHPRPALLVCFALVLLVQVLARDPRIQKTLVVLLLALNVGWLFFPVRPAREGVYFLDVGQGDCAVLVNTQGHAVVIDAGTFAVGNKPRDDSLLENMFLAREIISRAFWQVGVRAADAIFVSHLHADHISAIGRLARNFRARQVVISNAAGADPVLARFVATLPAEVQLRFVRGGEQMGLAGFDIEVVQPQEPVRADAAWGKLQSRASVNDNSMVL
ncbi:MAG: ComEC/Rec2 family competence protein, partial [Acidobacteria bacterium]|nr:ComEC/Rec2 family competence protein [Acidobacteriota bacterium]